MYADSNKAFPKKACEVLEDYSFDKDGGRLVVLKKKKRTIILDYAHEKHSLRAVLRLGKKLGKNCYGVIRLHPDRTTESIESTAVFIAKDADAFFVWDKVDGKRRKEFSLSLHPSVRRKVGEISGILARSIRSHGGKAQSLVQEEKAIGAALKASQPGDSIVIIVGEDKKYTMKALTRALASIS